MSKVTGPSNPLDSQRRLHYLAGGITQPKVWLTMAQLAEHAPFPTAEAARKFVTRHPELPRGRVGRHLRVDRDAFDRFISASNGAAAASRSTGLIRDRPFRRG